MAKFLDVAAFSAFLILQCKIRMYMESKITISESICRDEVVNYIASRYGISPRELINRFMCQEGILNAAHADNGTRFSFEENEMAILRDLGIRPSCVEFMKTEN